MLSDLGNLVDDVIRGVIRDRKPSQILFRRFPLAPFLDDVLIPDYDQSEEITSGDYFRRRPDE